MEPYHYIKSCQLSYYFWNIIVFRTGSQRTRALGRLVGYTSHFWMAGWSLCRHSGRRYLPLYYQPWFSSLRDLHFGIEHATQHNKRLVPTVWEIVEDDQVHSACRKFVHKHINEHRL